MIIIEKVYYLIERHPHCISDIIIGDSVYKTKESALLKLNNSNNKRYDIKEVSLASIQQYVYYIELYKGDIYFNNDYVPNIEHTGLFSNIDNVKKHTFWVDALKIAKNSTNYTISEDIISSNNINNGRFMYGLKAIKNRLFVIKIKKLEVK